MIEYLKKLLKKKPGLAHAMRRKLHESRQSPHGKPRKQKVPEVQPEREEE